MQIRTREDLRRYRWQALVAGMVTAALVYALLNTFALTRWEAVGFVRIGQTIGANWLDTAGQGEVGAANTMSEVLLMPVSLTVEQIRHPSFRDKVLGKIKRGGASPAGGAKDENYRVRNLVSGNIEIRARAPSRDRAQELIHQVVAELKLSHDAIYRERIARISSEKERVELRLREIIRSSQVQERRALSAESQTPGDPLPERGGAKELTAHLLEAYRYVLEERLDRSLTYPTDLFIPVHAPIEPVEPNWVMLGVYSLLSGVLATFVVVALSLSPLTGYLRKGEED